MNFTSLETRWGGGPDNPTEDQLRSALAELSTLDEEHPDTWLSDEDGWTVIVDQTGLVTFMDPEKEVARREGFSTDEALNLWLLLQQGDRASILKRLVSTPR